MNIFHKYSESFVSLFYPAYCLACRDSLVGNETILCSSCRLNLPETKFHTSSDNPVSRLFWGRLPIVHATSLLFFEKGGKYQSLIHQLKYNGKKDVGKFLGVLLGRTLQNTKFNDADVIVTVPLHKTKLRRRGYNQSDIIARSISECTGQPLAENALKRKINTRSQTTRGRYARWENVEGIFECIQPDIIENKHVLLIDDVVTTGATLEAAGHAILETEGTRLSIATTAFVS